MEYALSTYAEQPTMKLAEQSIINVENGKWKMARSPGNGVTNRYFVCNAHKSCGRMLKVQKQDDNMFCILLKGVHTTDPTFGKRKNSTLSWADEDRLKRAVDQGAKPGGVFVSLTKAKMEELQKDGMDPLEHKMEDGGLEGEHTKQPTHRILLEIRITYHVSDRIAVCITSWQVCISADYRIRVFACIVMILRSYLVSYLVLALCVLCQVWLLSKPFRRGRSR